MTRRLLGYALLADGVLIALFDGGYARIWPLRPVPQQVAWVSRRASEASRFLGWMIGVMEIGAGLALLAFTKPMTMEMKETAHEMKKRALKKKAA